MSAQHLVGCALSVLPTLEAGSVQSCVTSPPYWGLRDYGVEGQIGLERTPEEYVEKIVAVFREVRRVLRDDGTLWVNLGDSYAGSWGAQSRGNTTGEASSRLEGSSMLSARQITAHPLGQRGTGSLKRTPGVKAKDLVGIPWMVAFALRADGWYLRSDIIWSKPNPMPESVTDRPTKAHEYLFLLSKAERYYYDAAAIAEPASHETTKMPDGWDTGPGSHGSFHRNGREKGRKTLPETQANLAAGRDAMRATKRRTVRPGIDTNGGGQGNGAMSYPTQTRNRRSVWSVPTHPYPDAHFATFPPALIKPCILAGCPAGGTVLDPFAGAGTTGLVADRLNRNAILIELNPAYSAMAKGRIYDDAPLFSGESA